MALPVRILIGAALCGMATVHPAQAQLQATITGFRFGGAGNERIVDAVSDEEGNSYILGTYTQTFMLGGFTVDENAGTTFLAKLGPDDQWVWARTLPVVGALAVALHPDGGFVIFSGALTKLNADASAVEWTAEPDQYPFAFFPPAEVVVDDAGNIYCSILVNSSNLVWDGISTPFTGDIGTFVGKLGPDHQLQWAHQFGTVGGICWSNETVGNSLLLDGDDGVWLSGDFSGTESLFDSTVLHAGDGTCTLTPFVCHLSPDGNIDWLHGTDAGSTGAESTNSCLTPDGELFYLGGTLGIPFLFDGLSISDGLFSAVIDPSGTCTSLAGEGSYPGFLSNDLVLGPGNTVLLAGSRWLNDYGSDPMLLIQQDNLWYDILPGVDSLNESITNINRVSPTGFRAFGYFVNELLLPADTLVSDGATDAVVLRVEFDPSTGQLDPAISEALTITTGPSPGTVLLTASHPQAGAVLILDLTGRPVRSRPMNGTSLVLSTEGLATGLYVASVGGKSERFYVP